jgi:GntR family transcriptional regulator
MALEVLHVPATLVPGLTQTDLENRSFYELMEERYGILIASATQTIEPTVTSAEESEALGVPLHSPAFLFERTTLTTAGRPMEFVRSFYRGDRYQLVTELKPSRSRNGRVTLADARSGGVRGTLREEEFD